MNNLIIMLLFGFVSFYGRAQFIVPAIQPLMGVNYYRSTPHNYYDTDYQGVSFYYGIKGKLLLGNHVVLNATGGVKSYPFDYDYYGGFSLQAFVYRDYETGFSVFCELGGELSDWGDITMPFYVGTSQYFGYGGSFNFAVRIPTLIDVHYFETAGHIETGFEFGLQFDLVRKEKPVTRFGNPFFLQ